MKIIKQERPKSDLETFVDELYRFESEHPFEMFPMAISAEFALDCLVDAFLGEDWYTAGAISAPQVNTIILDEILLRYSSKYRRLIRKKQKEVRRKRKRKSGGTNE